MPAVVPTTEDFLLSAKRAEIAALKQLLISSSLVTKVTELIHELQRERGLSNTFLVSEGQRFALQREEEVAATEIAEQKFRQALAELDLNNVSPSSARLFSSIAFVLHCLEELAPLRARIADQSVSPTENTQMYNRLIAGLLAVVFEAADISNDPDITRALVAMFNFSQGKEYAGQERAWGLIGFTTGTFTSATQDRLHTMQEAQARCFDIFIEFSQTIPQAQWRQLESSEATHELDRLRQMVQRYRKGDSLPTAISEVWYEVATRRIDGMQEIERELATALLELCTNKITQAEEDLRLHREHLKELATVEEPPMSPLSILPEDAAQSSLNVAPGVNVKLARSIYELVQGQAERLQRISEELAEARQALEERKLIDKAKGLLIQSKGISEEEAYRQLRQAAMDNNKRIVDVAANVISVADMLKSR
ncbi:nitrate regulatory protein [uncultured Thalassolituus sp.]|uniref:nitrate regulatory protein n=1 Tax=uncultured Thalassolituus sp. TaxID=285273 RepID=UPI00261D2E09|nr:nitrate regulatory protein [uncultured Thalassolituus sp.]